MDKIENNTNMIIEENNQIEEPKKYKSIIELQKEINFYKNKERLYKILLIEKQKKINSLKELKSYYESIKNIHKQHPQDKYRRDQIFDPKIQNLIYALKKIIEDKNSILVSLEEELYSSSKQALQFLSNQLNNLQIQIKGLKDDIDNLKQKSLCSSYIIKYSSIEECEESIGGKNGILNFGFTFIINDFFEEMRYYRNIMNSFLVYNAFIGDLNKLDEDYINQINEQIKELKAIAPYIYYRLEIFNQNIHYDLVTKFLNVILQYILQEKDISTDCILKYIEGGYIIYIVLISIFALIICGIFWFYWIPMIRVLNMEIYKTKNMLTIIPVQILASLPNIRELLNISNKR